LLRRMSLSRSRVCPGVCTKAHEGVFQGAPRGGAHTSPPKFLERLQRVSVVDGATHTQKDDVESNGGSLKNVAEIFVLFLCGVQLVLRSGVFTILDLAEVDVMPRFAEVFKSMLSWVGGSTGGAAGMLPVSLNFPLPL